MKGDFVMAQKQKIFKEIEAGDFNKIVFSAVYEDDTLKALDIRTWWLNEGEWIPTKKGVRIKQEHLGEVLSAIIENIDSDTKFDILSMLDA